MNEILEWRDDEKKKDGIGCLETLFMNVYGMELEQDYPHNSIGRWRMILLDILFNPKLLIQSGSRESLIRGHFCYVSQPVAGLR